MEELSEGLSPAWERHYEVDDSVGGLHGDAPNLHQWPKWTEESDMTEFIGIFFSKEEFVECAFVSLCPVQPWEQKAQRDC